jgi:hypothetical protein
MDHFVICPSLFRIYTYSIHFLSRLTYCTYILCFFPFWSCQRSLQIPPSFTVDPLSPIHCIFTQLYILLAKLLPYCIFSQPNTHSTVYSPHPTVYSPPPKHSLYYIFSPPNCIFSHPNIPHTIYPPNQPLTLLYLLPTKTLTLLCMFRPSCICSLRKLLPYCVCSAQAVYAPYANYYPTVYPTAKLFPPPNILCVYPNS